MDRRRRGRTARLVDVRRAIDSHVSNYLLGNIAKERAANMPTTHAKDLGGRRVVLHEVVGMTPSEGFGRKLLGAI